MVEIEDKDKGTLQHVISATNRLAEAFGRITSGISVPCHLAEKLPEDRCRGFKINIKPDRMPETAKQCNICPKYYWEGEIQ